MLTKEQTRLIEKYDRPVPRYTSYPTAVHFTQELSPSDVTDRLSALNGSKPISLYIHIPFCQQLCYYCGCHTRAINDYKPIETYLELLLKEIDRVGSYLTHRVPVSRIHFGGGTPNTLRPNDVEKLLKKIDEFFTLSPATEIDMEMDPRILSQEIVKGYAALGLTRASLGVQDLNPEVQKAINRIQPFELVRDSMEWLHAAGVKQVNFDMMYGLPLQTPESISRGLEQALSLAPSRFAIFGYAHVPWMKQHQKLLEKFPLPDGMTRFGMNELMRSIVTKAGYQAIGIDHFALPEDSLAKAWRTHKLRRNFQGYTDDPADTIIGLGVSSITSFPDAYVQMATHIRAYREKLAAGVLPVTRGRILTADDRERRALINQLMCYFELDLDKTNARKKLSGTAMAKLADLQKDGLVEITGSLLRITEPGQPFARVVSACFDTYYDQEKKQHARAV